MTVASALLVAGLAVGFGWLIWYTATLRTTPAGYTKIATFDNLELMRARRVLERAGIQFILDDHSLYKGTGLGSSVGGIIHVLVPTEVADDATALLERERSTWAHRAPPA